MATTGQVSETNEDEPMSMNMLNDMQRAFFYALPTTFINQKALQFGVGMSVNSRKMESYLKYFANMES